jgi:hypothetical protein
MLQQHISQIKFQVIRLPDKMSTTEKLKTQFSALEYISIPIVGQLVQVLDILIEQGYDQVSI